MSSVTTFDVGVTTLTNVDAISNIALDVRDMAEALKQGEWVEARRIYESGKNSRQYDIYGQELDELPSLQRLAREGGTGMFNEDPSYMFQVLGLGSIGQSIGDTIAAHGNYADAYITEQLYDYNSGTLGAQASTILIVSMYARHMLWDGLQDCVAVQEGYDPEADKTGKVNPKQSFDKFMGLYIGAGQTLAPEWEGDMLYELAQAGGDLFDTTDSEGEALVNSDVKQFYQSIQRLMSQNNYCTTDNTIEYLWVLVNRILAKMYVPPIQMLIHSMKQEDQVTKVRMYALSVVPQISQCQPSVHRKLKDFLLDKEYNKDDFPKILELLQQSYDCLGITCEDVGTYKNGVVEACAGYSKSQALGGFVPKEDVRTLSKTDLDIRAIDQLLKFPSATNNKMAEFYYRYGRANAINTDDLRLDLSSLQDMTQLSQSGKWSPFYADYIEYFRKDKFLDGAILAAFEDSDSEQRSAFIVSLMRYNVVPEFMMGLLGLTLQVCPDEDNMESPTMYWDAFAALYIGSLEGIKPTSSEDDGVMLWNLAANRARQFNTQNTQSGAIINDEMIDLLFAGQSQLERRDCTNFEKTASRVLHLMLLPLIQSTIWYAIRNEEAAKDDELAIGEAMAYSVLPVVSKYDEDAATVIERNMIRSNDVKPVAEGPQTVANAFFKILDDIGWGCDFVGEAQGVDTCENFDPSALRNTASMPSGTAAIFAGIFSLMWATLMV